MNKTWPVAVLLMSSSALAGPAPGAVERPPYIGYVYPAGGRQGTTVEVVIGGEHIYGSTSALVSGKGVVVRVIDAGDPNAAGDEKKIRVRRNQTVLDEVVRLSIAIAPDAEPGARDLCLVTPTGLSNKRTIQVGQLKEIRETEPNDKRTAAVKLPELPVTINGQILPGDVDWFTFSARKGQRLVIEASIRTLIPYIADAVPGWFQGILALADAQGKELAVADDFRFSQDPVLFYDVPADGVYALSIRDSIYRGRQDFVYRVRIGELPFITGIVPLGAQRGEKAAIVKLFGTNLPADSLRVPVNVPAPSVQMLSVTRNGLVSNQVPFAVGALPEVCESEATTAQGKPQDVVPPVIINGCIRAPGETDAYRFIARKDQPFAIEVRARRLGSPLDSRIVLVNTFGEKIAENDDLKDKAEGFLTHQADSGLLCRLPSDGTYTLRIVDAQGKGGDEYAYRLRISPAIPDFELRAAPSEMSVPRGGSTALTIHAIRRDGFTGEIRIAIDEPYPQGLTLEGAVIPEGSDRVRMTISTTTAVAASTLFPALRGLATVNGKPIVRPVVPADEFMQAFAYQHLVTARTQVLTVTEPVAPFTVSPQLPRDGALTLPRGRETTFPVTITRRPGFDGPIRLQLVDPPKGITLQRAWVPQGRDVAPVTVRVESAAEVKANENLILTGLMVITVKEPDGMTEAGKPGEKPAAQPPPKTTTTGGASAGKAEQAPGATPAADGRPTPGTNPPPPAGAKDGKGTGAPPAAGGKDGKGKGVTPAAGKESSVPPEKKPLFQRYLVTLPAVPFRIVGELEGRKADVSRNRNN